MKQVLIALFLTLILSFSIIGFTQTVSETEDVVEKEDNSVITVN